MSFPIFLPTSYDSQYSLLGAMAAQLRDALARAGCRLVDEPDPSEAGAYIFFNYPDIEHRFVREIGAPGSKMAMLQIVVDHPYALDERVTDWLVARPNHRLVMPCLDSLHAMALRWPGIRHAHMPHAVTARDVITHVAAPYAKREFDLVIAGSFASEAQLERMATMMDPRTRAVADEIAGLLRASPSVTFEQAMDLALGARSAMFPSWTQHAALWRYVTARLNRLTRLDMLDAAQGIRALVVGADSIAEHCTGTLTYGGACAYEDVAARLAQGRVCLALGPTQFTHTFSERLLLGMAAGCACVADDRWMIGRHFETSGGARHLSVFPARDPGAARAAIDAALSAPEESTAMAVRGQREVRSRHLWDHRLGFLTRVIGTAVTRDASIAA
ncbi:MAG: glycosyltransferase [Phycisphaerales bacterium]